jgi:predicted ArsR family transcriptional regulator
VQIILGRAPFVKRKLSESNLGPYAVGVAARVSAAKRRLLEELKRIGPATAVDLAEALDLTDVAVRQHLSSLEETGLVTSGPGPTGGRGRPPTTWSLTDRARGEFPDHHAQLSIELIDAMRRAVGEAGLRKVVDARADLQVDAYRYRVPGTEASLRSRVGALARLRSAEGYMAEVVREGPDRFLLIEHHCPICEAATSCTGICRAEWDVFRRVLGDDVTVDRVEHLLSGGARCVYRLERSAAAET